MKNYIGRKIKGFKFEDGTDGLAYSPKMEKHIGEIGEIKSQDLYRVRIQFDFDWWHYPISLIEQHLVDVDTNVEALAEIPQVGQGVLMEASDDGVGWLQARISAKTSVGYYVGSLSMWRYARPIVKEYTKEELIKIIGHDFRIKE